MIRNPQRDALRSTITDVEFAKAMAALDLTSVPPEKRAAAILDHMAGIMIETVVDRSAAIELASARLMRFRR